MDCGWLWVGGRRGRKWRHGLASLSNVNWLIWVLFDWVIWDSDWVGAISAKSGWWLNCEILAIYTNIYNRPTLYMCYTAIKHKILKLLGCFKIRKNSWILEKWYIKFVKCAILDRTVLQRYRGAKKVSLTKKTRWLRCMLAAWNNVTHNCLWIAVCCRCLASALRCLWVSL